MFAVPRLGAMNGSNLPRRFPLISLKNGGQQEAETEQDTVMPGDPILQVRDLVVEYTSDGKVIHAVNGVNFDLERGKALALVGETGAGKTTIAKSIMRILPDPPAHVRSGQVVLQAGLDMEHPSRLAFQPGTMPDITLTGDASRLRQVVTNIVGNIHRYTPADSPVEVSMGVLPASISPESLSRMPSNEQSLHHFIEAIEVGQSMQVGMNYAIVRFSDHGPGVPADARSKIFERFYTADPSRARQKGGTGLGMAIAQSVVKAHHGFICASGSDGTGLTLTVVLPVAPVEPRPLTQTSDERKVDKRGRRPKKQ